MKRIAGIEFPDSESIYDTMHKKKGRIYLQIDDKKEWVLVFNDQHEELSRHNTRYLSSIIWFTKKDIEEKEENDGENTTD